MAAQENGATVETAKDRVNGRGLAKRPQKSSGIVRRMAGIIVRLCIWYALLTPLLHCPSNLEDLTDDSPKACKPYLLTRSHIDPYVTPYYETYAAPYVELAQPYAHKFNEHVYTPATAFTKRSFETYGAPWLERAQQYSHEQWQLVVVPQLHAAQSSASRLYGDSVEPYVKSANATITPYYNKARGNALYVHGTYVLPAYHQTKPFVENFLATGRETFSQTVLPQTRKTWSSIVVFVNNELWPKIAGLYSENVEPQLVKIGERLASYKDGKKLKSTSEEVEKSTESINTSVASSISSLTSTIEPSLTTSDSTHVSSETSAPTPLTPQQQIEQAREKIANDLSQWQEKFAVAADKGAEDLEQQVKEIAEKYLEGGAKSDGENLVATLSAVSDKEASALQTRINEIVQALGDDGSSEDEEKAQTDLFNAVRSAGLGVRNQGLALREWYLKFDQELARGVSWAVDSTLEVLDGVRDLGLQQIGMGWAWMDGVTYKDWAKYHALKKQLDDWRNEVRDVGMQHRSLEEAKSLAKEILADGMAVAETAAKELARLKEVGAWKIEARDTSEDFSTRNIPASVVRAVNKAAKAASEKIEATSTLPDLPDEEAQPTSSEASKRAETLATSSETAPSESPHKEDPIPQEPDSSEQNNANAESDPVQPPEEPDSRGTPLRGEESTQSAHKVWGGAVAQSVSSSGPVLDNVEDDERTKVSEKLQSIASAKLQEGLQFASSHYSNVKEAARATPTPGHEQLLLDAQRRYYEAVGLAHDQYSAFISSVSGAVYGTPTPVTEKVYSSGSEAIYRTAVPAYRDLIDDAKSQYSAASSLVSASLDAVVSSASSAAGLIDKSSSQGIVADASSRYSAAMSAASKSLDSASSAASQRIYGTPTGNWEAILSKASEQIYGTPTPFSQQVLNQAHDAPSSFASAASSYAGDVYESASSAAAPFVTPLAVVEDILSSAQGKLDSAVDVVSELVYGTSKGQYEQATSAAASVYKSASSQLSAAVYSHQPGYVELARSQVDEAVSSAQSALSTAIYGTPTPTDAFGSASSTASSVYAAATSAVGENVSAGSVAVESAYSHIQSGASSLIFGEQQGALESATSRLFAAVESAQARLADMASQAQEGAAEGMSAAQSAVEDISSSVSSAASQTTGHSRDEL